MTTPDPPFLESDRIIFKLFACEEHLKNIKKIKLQHGDLLSKDARVSAEMEIDSLISQIIGTVDSLLFRIIDKFQLTGIRKNRIEMPTVISGLSAESKGVEIGKRTTRRKSARQLVLEDRGLEKLFIEWLITFARRFFGRHSIF